jgi:hypothetical protein
VNGPAYGDYFCCANANCAGKEVKFSCVAPASPAAGKGGKARACCLALGIKIKLNMNI